jgi:two-component SAPR family response regulator
MIKAILVDDEILALNYLTNLLEAFPMIHIINTYTDKTSILEDIQKETVDVVFLDIEMADGNGLDFAETIYSLSPSIQIVFVTAYAEHAIKAFELNSIDYLLKPVMPKRLAKTIQRLSETIINNKVDRKLEKPSLTIQCFHEFQVLKDGELLHFKTAKVKELLAYFVTFMNTYIPRDQIIESLWPDHDRKKAKINLHTCLSHLRKLLSVIGYTNCIKFSNQSYIFSMNSIHCDFTQINEVVLTIEKVNESNILHVEEVLKLYSGSYMEWNHYEWANELAQKIETDIIIILEKVIDYYSDNDCNKALYYLHFQRKLTPYLDRNIERTMHLLIQKGNYVEAMKIYNVYEQLLSEDLGVEPGERLATLYQSLRIG